MTTVELTNRSWSFARKLDRVWIFIAAVLGLVAYFDFAQLSPTLEFAIAALLSTAPFILIAIFAIGYLKASGAEKLVAAAFQGNEVRMIFFASIVGGIAPFCSCEIIPFIAALLAVGTPLSAVMALWLASPIMDPSIFLITAGELGWGFAVAKSIAAISLGLIGGFTIKAALGAGYFQDVLLKKTDNDGGCCTNKPFEGNPVWKFWQDNERVKIFLEQVRTNGLFLLKWLALAYVFESLMIRYIPAETIAGIVGGTGILPIVISAFVGAPAYLNGYAAPAIVSGLMEQGMTSGAAMTFMVAGGVTSIPAMTAVFALVKRSVFITYVGLGISGAILSGILFNAYLALI